MTEATVFEKIFQSTNALTQVAEIDGKYGLICGDCVDVMKSMKDRSVDVVFTSPPYNDRAKTARAMQKRRNQWRKNRRKA